VTFLYAAVHTILKNRRSKSILFESRFGRSDPSDIEICADVHSIRLASNM
jgi:hypothetical protein